MPEAPEAVVRPWIETFQARTRLDLRPLWQVAPLDGPPRPALDDPWGQLHRPDWVARGLVVWPRGGRWHLLRCRLECPAEWQKQQQGDRQARLVLRWWADAVVLRVNGVQVHQGDLFDTACRWLLPETWWQGQPLALELMLRSPLHDDGALITSQVDLEPCDHADPTAVLQATVLTLQSLRQPQALAAALEPLDPLDPAAPERLAPLLAEAAAARPQGGFQVLGHAHLDMAWLWPVADTWQAAIRTFGSALALLERYPQLHFAHSTPALYAWIEQHQPALFAAIRRAMQAGRWEPINGPWVETDCVLISTASLLRQFLKGQRYSRERFPEWRHELCWLPDSFGFAAGLPAVAQATGVRWFCTHKLAWNATNPFPHRLFRWRSRCGAEVLALMHAPIGTDGDPLAMEAYRLQWERGSGVAEALWLPGVGDHGGGPTAEMLEQLELWQQQPLACPQQYGTLRDYLGRLEPLQAGLPVWRDELYLELHRGCATSRPDQKRHNRSLERLLREAELAAALLVLEGGEAPGVDWRPLLFQQFHDILPGTSIPEVFEQAEPQWCAARRTARQHRDGALQRWLAPYAAPDHAAQPWWLVQLQPLAAAPLCLRLPQGRWSQHGERLPCQLAPGGGQWVQIACPAGVAAVALQRRPEEPEGPELRVLPVLHPVQLRLEPSAAAPELWSLSNGLITVELGPEGVRQLWGADGLPQLAGPLQWRRWRDHGEFWDAWDLAGDYRDHPLELEWLAGPMLVEQGPLCSRLVWRGWAGQSALRLDVQLRAGCPWLEISLTVDWRQQHELLRLELPLAQVSSRYAADTSGGVLERPAAASTPREQARWEVPAISWIASQGQAGGLAVLLAGPQGVSAQPDRLGISLLRAPTWPDPSADNGYQRLRLALLPCPGGWRQAAVPQQAVRFREPVWLRPQLPRDRQVEPAPMALPSALRLGTAALHLVGLRPDPEGEAGVALLTVQNLSPLRQVLELPDPWCLLDGPSKGWLQPWQLLSVRVGRCNR